LNEGFSQRVFVRGCKQIAKYVFILNYRDNRSGEDNGGSIEYTRNILDDRWNKRLMRA
jgi:hypothetical protein